MKSCKAPRLIYEVWQSKLSELNTKHLGKAVFLGICIPAEVMTAGAEHWLEVFSVARVMGIGRDGWGR